MRNLKLVWKDRIMMRSGGNLANGEPYGCQLVEVQTPEGEVLGVIPSCSDVKYTPIINGVGHLTLTMTVEDGTISTKA